MNLKLISGNSATTADGGTFRPQLTSLVDVMTILLVFLIKSFSVEGTIVTPSPDLQLPLSTAKRPPKPVCTIEISKARIVSDGQVIAQTGPVAEQDSMIIPALYDWMIDQKIKSLDSSKTRDVLIQSDKEIHFAVIKKVMFTCSKAGFEDFSVLVLEEE
jgi:biopolymer transport protein ExbD